MSATLDPGRVVLRDLLRDTRHLGARAASDLADWLAHLGFKPFAGCVNSKGVNSPSGRSCRRFPTEPSGVSPAEDTA